MSKGKRPISPRDVIFGSTGFPLILGGILYGLDRWLISPTILAYPVNLIGIASILAGVSLASWCFRVVQTLPHEPILVNIGPWSHIRHPIYLVEQLNYLGIALISGTLLLIGVFIAFTLLEMLVVTLEEAKLRKHMPEYVEYAKRVPRWIPRIRRHDFE